MNKPRISARAFTKSFLLFGRLFARNYINNFQRKLWNRIHESQKVWQNLVLLASVANHDPNPDPHVFWPPGSGSGSYYEICKNSKKNLDSDYFVTLFDFLSLKNDVNVASKRNKQKILFF
jgi:hypothetical protein